MTATHHQIDRIFKSLESAGYPLSVQQMLLPEWVTAEVLSDGAVSSEIATILAKRLGLRASPLFSANPRVESLRRQDVKYKRSLPNKSKNLTAATAIAVSFAESIASACCVSFRPLPVSARELRMEVLSEFSGKWLGLRNLLLTCWSHGIPVVYLSGLGKGIAKMDGMVVYTNSRPVIILAKSSSLWAWQLFILAHELAHLALGHVADDEILIDENLDEKSYAVEDDDIEELEANKFAIELLNGRPDATYTTETSSINDPELVQAAYLLGVERQVDPGHIALNFARHSGQWGVGVNAAKRLQGENPPASAVIAEAMWDCTDLGLLPSDTVEFLRRVAVRDN